MVEKLRSAYRDGSRDTAQRAGGIWAGFAADQLGAKSPPIRSTPRRAPRQTTERHEVHGLAPGLPFRKAEGSSSRPRNSRDGSPPTPLPPHSPPGGLHVSPPRIESENPHASRTRNYGLFQALGATRAVGRSGSAALNRLVAATRYTSALVFSRQYHRKPSAPNLHVPRTALAAATKQSSGLGGVAVPGLGRNTSMASP